MLKVAVAVFVLVAVCYAQPPPAPTPPDIPETFMSMVKVNFNSKADKTCGIAKYVCMDSSTPQYIQCRSQFTGKTTGEIIWAQVHNYIVFQR